MGDRTTVTIQVKESHWIALAKKYDGGDEDKFESRVGVEENEFLEEGTVHLIAHEVNYGEWNTLEDLLRNEQVPFDKSWGAGSEYRGGHAYYRNVDGQYQGYEMYEGEDDAIADLEYALECIKKYPPDLAASIIEGKIKQKKPFVPTPLNESNSIVFMKDLAKEEVGES
jgi:hypothetical protein